MSGKYKCPSCNEEYPNISYKEDSEDMCTPCASQKWYDEFEAKQKREIEKYNKRTGSNWTLDGFYDNCEDVDITTLKGFPELRKIVEFHNDMVNEQSQEPDPQIELNFTDKDDLPF